MWVRRKLCTFAKKITKTYENRYYNCFARNDKKVFLIVSIMSRAQKKGIAEIHIHNLR